MKNKHAQNISPSLIEIALTGNNLTSEEKFLSRQFLISLGICENSHACSEFRGAYRLTCYVESKKLAQKIQKHYQKLKSPAFRLELLSLKKEDWFDKWKRDYHIRPIGKNFVIVPEWEKEQFIKKSKTPIFIDPGSAFGSGDHETTRLMTSLLEMQTKPIGTFLDAGCGTGILSIVASHLGSTEIIGFDNDRPSAIFAEKNFKLNNRSNGKFLFAQLKNLKTKKTFDIVGANLLSRVLVELKNQLVSKVRCGGNLLLSGISIENFPQFKKDFASSQIRVKKIFYGKRWVAVWYKKKGRK